MSKKIYITGISGSGKSAIAKELKNRGIFAFDIEQADGLCSWVDKKTHQRVSDYIPTRDWLEAHDWICDEEKLKEHINTAKDTIIVTGIATNQDDYLKLFDKIFLLQCKEKTFLNRLETRHTKPGENGFGKLAAEREYALKGYRDFEDKMIKVGAIPINAELPITEVADKILSKV